LVYDDDCPFCDAHNVDGGNCLEGGLDDAQYCIKEKYDLIEWSDSGSDLTFDKDIPPESDPTGHIPPYMGTASLVRRNDMNILKHIKKLKSVGIGMATAGGSVDLFVILSLIRKKLLLSSCEKTRASLFQSKQLAVMLEATLVSTSTEARRQCLGERAVSAAK
jgi:hypothetical protein